MAKRGVSILIKILLVIILSTTLFGSNLEVEKKIYTSIIHAVFPNKHIRLWTDSKEKKSFLGSIDGVTLVQESDDADFLILQHTSQIKSHGIKFATNYKVLRYYQNDIIGGFYWQKGRPNILFLKPYLKQHHINLPSSLDTYVESSI